MLETESQRSELPVFLLNDVTGGVSAYDDREMLDAAIVPAEECAQLSAWRADGERLNITVEDGRWQIASNDPPVFDIEILRDLLLEHLKLWYGPTAIRVNRDRIIDRAAAYFKVKRPPSRWRRVLEGFAQGIPWFGVGY